MDYRLYVVRVFVTDWERAATFYTETLGMEPTFRSDEMGWMQLATGGAELALERADPNDAESAALVGRYVGVSLAVDDIEAVHRALADRGVRFRSPPTAQPWGGVLAHFDDPDGNTLTLLGAPADS